MIDAIIVHMELCYLRHGCVLHTYECEYRLTKHVITHLQGRVWQQESSSD